jgi:acid phosphatase type 7
METWQALGGLGAGRTATALVIVASVVAVLVAVGCRSERSPSPSEQPPSSSERPPSSSVVVAAGDIATCSGKGDEATATLVGGLDGTVLALGDNVYPDGSTQDFEECYDPSWGRFKDRTRPIPGNHEYYTQGAEGYFDYFGKAAGDPDEGYYSYNLGEWHIVALNTNCGEAEVRCGPGSAQREWLQEDLAANEDKRCTLVNMHHPRFSSGEKRGSHPKLEPLWEALYEAGAEVVLSGDEHNYERFAPQDPGGEADPQGGIRQFVVGTGGRSHYPISDPLPNSEVHNDDTYGVLKLTLNPKSYQWRFVPVEGETFSDSGSAQCH